MLQYWFTVFDRVDSFWAICTYKNPTTVSFDLLVVCVIIIVIPQDLPFSNWQKTIVFGKSRLLALFQRPVSN